MILQHLFDVVSHRVALIARLDRIFLLAIVAGVELGVLRHLVHFFLAQAGAGSDGDLLFVLRALVGSRHVQNAIGVDVESDLNLRYAARCRRNSHKLKYAQQAIVFRHRPFALEDLDIYRSLAVGSRRESLALLGRNRRVALDQLGKDAAESFDTQRKRGHVQQQYILYFATQHAALDCGPNGHHFVRVHGHVRFLTEEVAHHFAHLRDTGGSTHQHHFVDLLRRDASVGDRLLAGVHHALQNRIDHLLKTPAGQLLFEVLRPGGIGGDEGQVDVDFELARKFDLRGLGGVAQPLQRHLVLAQVDAVFILEFGDEPLHDPVVDVVAAEVRVAVGRLHFHHAIANFENRDVEGAAAKVEYGDRLVLLLVEAISERSRRRLVDDALYFEARDLAGILGRLTLCVVEISGNRDHRFGDFFTQISFCGFLQLLQHERADLGRSILFALHFNAGTAAVAADDRIRYQLQLFAHFIDTASHKALRGVDGILGVGDGLALRHLTH